MKTIALSRWLPLAASLSIAALVGGTAHAQQQQNVDVDVYEYEEEDTGRAHLITPYGMSFSIGGGVENFTDDRTRDITGVAGTWQARLGIGTRQLWTFEAAYIGSAQEIAAVGLDDDAVLMSNGAEGLVRLNFTTEAFQPYLFAGAAYRAYRLVNEDFNTSSVENSDDVFQVPVGAGVAFRYRGLVMDGRFDIRPTFDEELIGDQAENELTTWNASARIGFEF